MTNATMHRSFDPGRSPLFGVAAVFAAAATIWIAVLLPLQATPTMAPVAAIPVAVIPVTQAVDVQVPVQVVTLPAVEVVGKRETKSAASRWTVPAAFKQKG